MNRTTLAYRIATLAVVGAITFGWLRIAAADEQESPSAKPAPAASQPQSSSQKSSPVSRTEHDKDSRVAVYRLRYADLQTTLMVLRSILEGDDKVRITLDPKNNGLIVFGPQETHNSVRKVLENLDARPGAEHASQVKIFHLLHVEPSSAARILPAILPERTQVATDERTRSVIVSGSPDSLAVAEALLMRLDEGAERERPKSSGHYAVQVVWLANDNKADLPAEGLKDVVAELSRLGIKDPRQVGQVVVRNSSARAFQITSSPMFDGSPANFKAAGSLSEQRDGTLALQIKIETTKTLSGQTQELNQLDTQIVVPERQYVVLATAPVGKITSAFVVQVIVSPKPTELK